MTGRLVYPIVDKFIVQWEEMKKVSAYVSKLGPDEGKPPVKEHSGKKKT